MGRINVTRRELKETVLLLKNSLTNYGGMALPCLIKKMRIKQKKR